MNKTYERINWENEPSIRTPLNEVNLNKMDFALNELDDRVVSFDTTKANESDALLMFNAISYDEKTGKFIFTRKNGTKVVVDTLLEKVVTNFRYDATTQQLILTTSEGESRIDLSALITQYEFLNSDNIQFVIEGGKVKARVIAGSIKETDLAPQYLAEITEQVESAHESASRANTSAILAESYAKGETGTREGEDIDNAKHYKDEAKSYKEQAAAIVGIDIATTNKAGIVKPDGTTITIEADGTIKVPKVEGVQYPLIQATDICQEWRATKEYKKGDLCYGVFYEEEQEYPNPPILTTYVNIYVAIKDNINVDPFDGFGEYWEFYFSAVAKKITEETTDTLTINGTQRVEGAEGNIQSISFVGESRKSKNLFNDYTNLGYYSRYSQTYNGHSVIGSVSTWGGAFDERLILKANTKYNISFAINVDTPSEIRIFVKNAPSTLITRISITETNKWIKQSIDFTPTEDVGLVRIENATSGVTTKISEFQVVEGSNIEYEPYGILTPQGKVESGTKNLINLSSGKADNSNVSYSNGVITFTNSNYNALRVSLNLKANVRYTLSYRVDITSGGSFIGASIDGTSVMSRATASGNYQVSFTPNQDQTTEFAFCGTSATSSGKFYEVQLEEGTTATTYVPYKHSLINASEIAPDKPLYGIGDIKNTLEVFADGSGVYTQRVGSFEFPRSEVQVIQIPDLIRVYSNDIPNVAWGKGDVTNVMSDILPSSHYGERGVSLRDNTIQQINAFFSNTEVPFTALGGYQTWYDQGNRIKGVYELATPIITPLTSKEVAEFLSLKTFNNGTITTDGTVDIVYYKNNGNGQTVASLGARVNANTNDIADTKSMISDEWSKTKTYAQGEYCISNNSLWKSKVNNNIGNVPTEGSYWTASSVSKVLTPKRKTVTVNNANWVAVYDTDVKNESCVVANVNTSTARLDFKGIQVHEGSFIIRFINILTEDVTINYMIF